MDREGGPVPAAWPEGRFRGGNDGTKRRDETTGQNEGGETKEAGRRRNEGGRTGRKLNRRTAGKEEGTTKPKPNPQS